MPILVLDPTPSDFDALVERRRRLGIDLHDEVWEGVLHMVPGPHSAHGKLEHRVSLLLNQPAQAAGLEPAGPVNIGSAEDYRVPDRALLRPGPDAVYLPSAALVVEIVSPGDETWAKLPFYAAHGVDELLIVEPQERAVHLLALREGGYEPVEHSAVIDLDVQQLAAQIDWP
ncbi:MAG TPA: Uma2 family endonuclease [Solirubrobacteraceae bacterium]|nr:Uma2 family endonuclease [Solirubrobacteraceae bacterium]